MIGLADVREAAGRLRGAAHRTPVLTSRTLDGRAGPEVFLKCENLQRVGAFKFRGAFNAVSRLSPEQRRRGVITHSSGNHAQALALAARLQGLKAVIVMPEGLAAGEGAGHPRHLRRRGGALRQHPASPPGDRRGPDRAARLHPGPPLRQRPRHRRRRHRRPGAAGGGPGPGHGHRAGRRGGLLSGTSTAARGLRPGIEVLGAEPRRPTTPAARWPAAGSRATSGRTPWPTGCAPLSASAPSPSSASGSTASSPSPRRRSWRPCASSGSG